MGEKSKRKKALNKRILDVSEGWVAPFPHDSEQRAKLAVLARIGNFAQEGNAPVQLAEERKEPKVIRINTLSWMQVAAAVLALVSLPYILWLVGEAHTTNAGESFTEIELPDGSDVRLGGGSSIEYNELTWMLSRTVEFEGEAYFDVEPGSVFEVRTDAGDVRVMGTKFSVWANGNSLFVHCSEGSVAVELGDSEVSLSAGEFTRRNTKATLAPKQKYSGVDALFPGDSPEMHFESVPVGIVLARIEEASNTTIFSSLDEHLKYTGTLHLNRTKESLELVCKPFGAKFETNAQGFVTITP